MRKEFELSEEELNTLYEACKPVPYIIVGGYMPRTPQQNANAAWQALGSKLGFKWDTVKSGKSERFFSAEVMKGGKNE